MGMSLTTSTYDILTDSHMTYYQSYWPVAHDLQPIIPFKSGHIWWLISHHIWLGLISPSHVCPALGSYRIFASFLYVLDGFTLTSRLNTFSPQLWWSVPLPHPPPPTPTPLQLLSGMERLLLHWKALSQLLMWVTPTQTHTHTHTYKTSHMHTHIHILCTHTRESYRNFFVGRGKQLNTRKPVWKAHYS